MLLIQSSKNERDPAFPHQQAFGNSDSLLDLTATVGQKSMPSDSPKASLL